MLTLPHSSTLKNEQRGRTPVQHVSTEYTVLIPRRSGAQIDPDRNLSALVQPAPHHDGRLISTLSLTVLSESSFGREDRFASGTSLWVGRGRAMGLRFADDRKVSRFHAQIDIDQDAVRLFDMDSLNGTRVNGRRVRIARLRDGDIIEIGLTILLVRLKTR